MCCQVGKNKSKVKPKSFRSNANMKANKLTSVLHFHFHDSGKHKQNNQNSCLENNQSLYRNEKLMTIPALHDYPPSAQPSPLVVHV
jgi:hypothetical protein